MACYYDSSFLLAAVLKEQTDEDYFKIWDKDPVRLSSNIMKVECTISIKRAGLLLTQKNKEWIQKSIQAVSVYFSFITFKKYDDEIEKLIIDDNRFASCRTLDAIHLASAYYFKPYLQEEIVVCTFDKRMNQTAHQLGFTTHPEEL